MCKQVLYHVFRSPLHSMEHAQVHFAMVWNNANFVSSATRWPHSRCATQDENSLTLVSVDRTLSGTLALSLPAQLSPRSIVRRAHRRRDENEFRGRSRLGGGLLAARSSVVWCAIFKAVDGSRAHHRCADTIYEPGASIHRHVRFESAHRLRPRADLRLAER